MDLYAEDNIHNLNERKTEEARQTISSLIEFFVFNSILNSFLIDEQFNGYLSFSFLFLLQFFRLKMGLQRYKTCKEDVLTANVEIDIRKEE